MAVLLLKPVAQLGVENCLLLGLRLVVSEEDSRVIVESGWDERRDAIADDCGWLDGCC
jgi:hypothetical protein